MSILRPLFALLLLSLLGACSILPKSEVLSIYRLPASPLSSQPAAVEWALRVNKPYSSQLLDSTRITLLPPGDQISAYQGVRWSDRAPLLLRDRLIDAFRDDGRIPAVSSDDSRLHADLELAADLRAFHSEYRDGQPVARIVLDARLVQSGSLRILASRRFVIEHMAADASVSTVVQALGLAADKLSRELVDWTLEQGQATQQP
jgi:cholesterol transport system auxiliary component